MQELWNYIISIMHIDAVVNFQFALAAAFLLMMAWFFFIRYMQLKKNVYLLLSAMFLLHTFMQIPLSLHRYFHEDWVRAITRLVAWGIIAIMIWFFFRYRLVFLGKRRSTIFMSKEHNSETETGLF